MNDSASPPSSVGTRNAPLQLRIKLLVWALIVGGSGLIVLPMTGAVSAWEWGDAVPFLDTPGEPLQSLVKSLEDLEPPHPGLAFYLFVIGAVFLHSGLVLLGLTLMRRP